MSIEDDLTTAREYISQDPGPPRERFDLAKRLANAQYFTHARKVLRRADLALAGEELQYDIQRKLALFTYKDKDEPAADRLDQAEEILTRLLDRQPPKQRPSLQQDVCGILGAVHKQRWWTDGKAEHLAKSFEYYKAGYKMGTHLDYYGYTAGNAAFVEDLLAETYEKQNVPHTAAASSALHLDAEKIRRELIAALGDATGKAGEDRFWDCTTLGEAHLGIGEYDKACEWMKEAGALVESAQIPNWAVETTARQFARLVQIEEQKKRPTDGQKNAARQVIDAFLGGDSNATNSFLRGKFGLALSGGGFRASLFHIGVLAKLAEMDLLRHIEVLSCVSGGSILGAYYYLELQKLLKAKDTPDRADYIQLVQGIERNFLRGVQKNIRMRMLLSPGSNLRLALRKSSTTNRLGYFYEKDLYALVEDGKQTGNRLMSQLIVKIKDGFNPKYDNWQRPAKVPILVLNATSLNTCHNWQFTATTIGEPPPSGGDSKIDANERLRRLWYSEAPADFQEMRLGEAVAASACVPGLFDPLALDKLHEGYLTRLVDGGVFDNQGVASLLEQDCTVLFVSDASGQTGVETDPKPSNLAVPLRANNILMARVRQCEYQHLESLRAAEVLKGLGYVHLKEGLKARTVDWIGCVDKSDNVRESQRTGYGMRRDIQALLAAVRTDLDAFSDIEADCLMLSGYLMTEKQIEQMGTFPNATALSDTGEEMWRFPRVAAFACATDHEIAAKKENNSQQDKLKRSLAAAHFGAFKTVRLIPHYEQTVKVLKWLVVIGGGLLCWHYWRENRSLGELTTARVAEIVAAAILVGLSTVVLRWWRRGSPAWHYLLAVVSLLFGWNILPLYLGFIDRIYLRSGPRYSKEYPPFYTGTTETSEDKAKAAGQGGG